MFYEAETRTTIAKIEDILNSCDLRLLRYLARMTRKDRLSCEEVATRCGLKEIQWKTDVEKVTLVM